MLILTRRIGETILIGENIRITVLDTKGTQVKIGTDAPADVEVFREEVLSKRRQSTE